MQIGERRQESLKYHGQYIDEESSLSAKELSPDEKEQQDGFQERREGPGEVTKDEGYIHLGQSIITLLGGK
jgi:hypothetical protein